MSDAAAHPVAAWRAANLRRAIVSLIGMALLLVSFSADVATGPAMLPIEAVLRSLAGRG